MKLSKELETAIIAARAGEKVVMKYFRGNFEVAKKKDDSLVTNADKESEAAIIKVLKKNFPSYNIYAEESGYEKKDSEYTWLVDPLDGTTNFARGIPYFGVSVGLVKGDEKIVAAIINPATGELFYAEKGKGAFRNGKKISVSNVTSLKDSGIGISIVAKKLSSEKYAPVYLRVMKSVAVIFSFGSISIGLCDVASGRTEARIATKSHPDDCITGTLIVEEAGGKVQLLNRTNLTFTNLGDYIATNGKIHNALMKVINNSGGKI